MPGPSYTSISDYLGANQGTLANEANQVGNDVSGQLAAAKTADNAALAGTPATAGDYTTTPGYAAANQGQIAATQNAQALGSPSGLAGLLQNDYHATGYNQDGANFDGQLLSASNPSSFAPLEKQGQSLSGYLQAGPQSSASNATRLASPTAGVDPATPRPVWGADGSPNGKFANSPGLGAYGSQGRQGEINAGFGQNAVNAQGQWALAQNPDPDAAGARANATPKPPKPGAPYGIF